MSIKAKLSNSMRNTMSFRRTVHAKTGGRCYYCGVHLRCADEEPPCDWLLVRGGGNMMIPDHAHPKARGGPDGAANRLPSCGACNAAKGRLTVDEFRLLKALRVGDLSFRFPGDMGPFIPRDWLCVHSPGHEERDLFLNSYPQAREAYSRRRLAR